MKKLYFKIMAVLFAGTIAVVALTGCKYGAPPPRNIQESTIINTINVTPSKTPSSSPTIKTTTSSPTTTPISSTINE